MSCLPNHTVCELHRSVQPDMARHFRERHGERWRHDVSLDVVAAIAAGPWRCPVMSCNLPFVTEELRDEHRYDVHGAPLPVRTHPAPTSERSGALEGHRPLAPRPTLQAWPCRVHVCTETFASLNDREDHMRSAHPAAEPTPVTAAATQKVQFHGSDSSPSSEEPKPEAISPPGFDAGLPIGGSVTTLKESVMAEGTCPVPGCTKDAKHRGRHVGGGTLADVGGNRGRSKSPTVSTPKAQKRSKPARRKTRRTAPKRPARAADNGHVAGDVTLSAQEASLVFELLSARELEGTTVAELTEGDLVAVGLAGKLKQVD